MAKREQSKTVKGDPPGSRDPGSRRRGASHPAHSAGRKPARNARRQDPGHRTAVIGGAVAVIVLLAIIAVVVTDSAGEPADPQAAGETRPVEVTGEPLPEADAGGSDPAIGQTAPELHGASFDGDPVQVTADGTPKLLVFLAHWCPHCQAEVPRLTEWLQGSGKPDGLDVIAIATSTTPERPNYPPSEWLDREGFPAPVLADSAQDAAARAYGLSGFPYFVALDGDGKVVDRAAGELTTDQLDRIAAHLTSG